MGGFGRLFVLMVLDDSDASLKRAAEIILAGGIVALPTETVYGLAAKMFIIAGPIIVFGVVSSAVVGAIYYIIGLF